MAKILQINQLKEVIKLVDKVELKQEVPRLYTNLDNLVTELTKAPPIKKNPK